MAPKNQKPEKCVELKEGWTDHLPLKDDDKTYYGDRFGIQFSWKVSILTFLRNPLT